MLELRLSVPNQFSCAAIYHCLQEIDVPNLERTIKTMISKNILSTERISVDQWRHEFLTYLFRTENVAEKLQASADECEKVISAFIIDMARRKLRKDLVDKS